MSNRLYSQRDKSHHPTYKWGFWYIVPSSLTLEEWDKWKEIVSKKHPTQYFIREMISQIRYSLSSTRREWRRKIKAVFKPYHSDIRQTISREWADISVLIIDVNHQMILSFKKEADESFVDWDSTPDHKEFKNWLDSAAQWIKNDRPALLKQQEQAYPPHPLPNHMRALSYDELYSEVNKIEKIIDETDSNILKQMISFRHYFWT